MTYTDRPDWDTYFLNVAKAIAERADCRRRKVGCVIVDADHRIIATGYNGAVSGGGSCLAGDCPRGLLSYDEVKEFSDYMSGPGRCIAIHAEANAVIWARTSCKGATAYITDPPCPQCRLTLSGAQVKRIVWSGGDITL